MVDISLLTSEELKALASDIQTEIKKREEDRFHELVAAAVSALKTLKSEFPFVNYPVEILCTEEDHYGYMDIDLMAYVDKMQASKFFK